MHDSTAGRIVHKWQTFQPVTSMYSVRSDNIQKQQKIQSMNMFFFFNTVKTVHAIYTISTFAVLQISNPNHGAWEPCTESGKLSHESFMQSSLCQKYTRDKC